MRLFVMLFLKAYKKFTFPCRLRSPNLASGHILETFRAKKSDDCRKYS